MPSTPGWQDVRFVNDGERVDAKTTRRPSDGLASRTDYLKNRLDAIENKGALFAFGVPVDSTVLPNDAVYYDSTAGLYRPARFALQAGSDGSLVAAPSAIVAGVVYQKPTANSADLVLVGVVPLSGFSVAGSYCLSGTTPGGVVLRSPGTGVFVLESYGDGTVRVFPTPPTAVSGHTHYRFDLSLELASTELDQGWLPVEDASFGGLAPAGTVKGYNLSAHPELAGVWPPFPVKACGVVLFGPTAGGLGLEIPTGTDGLVILDENGIWWRRDCYGQSPWDWFPSTSLSGEESEGSLAVSETCPVELPKRLVLYFSRADIANDNAVVTSLAPYDKNGPLSIVGCDGAPATNGPLRIRFSLNTATTVNDALGGVVVKEFDGLNPVRGSVAEGLVLLDDTLTAESSQSRYLTPGDATTPKVYQGIVKLRANIEPRVRLIQPQVVRLLNALDRYDDGIIFYGMPANFASGLRLLFKVPGPDGFSVGSTASVRLWLKGDAVGTLPALTLAYRLVPVETVPAALPGTDSSLPVTTSATLTSADQYLQVESDAVVVAAADLFYVTLTRSAADGYAGEVGLLDAALVLTPPA